MDTRSEGRHDIVIVGGGLVGASLAIALEATGLDVALVEATGPGAMPAVFDERSLSFGEATVNALTALDVIPRLRTGGGPIARIEITRAGEFGRARLDAERYGRRAFGQVVVARDFGEALESRLAGLARLTRYRPARFVDSSLVDGLREVRIDTGEGALTLRARLLVGADGTASGVRRTLGIATETRHYGHALFVARLRAARGPDGTAFERLTQEGPTALLPRADRHFGLVHGVADALADEVDAMGDARFVARVQETVGWRHGRLLGCGPRSRYPARRVVSRETTAAQAVLIGNAAQTLHPLGAQGFNLGLRDALTLAEEVAAGGRDALGGDAQLGRYIARREDDRRRTLAFSDGLLRVGMRRSAWAAPLRSVAMMALDHPSWLQAWLVGGAMGYRGDVPALCRDESTRRRA